MKLEEIKEIYDEEFWGVNHGDCNMKRLSIFVHHDKYNIIDDYVVYWLKTMNKLSDIIFISNNDLPEIEINKIKNFTIKNIIGNHGGVANVSLKKGYFYAYDNNLLERYDWLFIISDSIYGPFFDIEPFIRKEEEKLILFTGDIMNFFFFWFIPFLVFC